MSIKKQKLVLAEIKRGNHTIDVIVANTKLEEVEVRRIVRHFIDIRRINGDVIKDEGEKPLYLILTKNDRQKAQYIMGNFSLTLSILTIIAALVYPLVISLNLGNYMGQWPLLEYFIPLVILSLNGAIMGSAAYKSRRARRAILLYILAEVILVTSLLVLYYVFLT